MTIHINQRYNLVTKYKEYFNFDSDQFSDKVKDITDQKYRFLLALYYQKKLNEMRLEIIKLGITLWTTSTGGGGG